jgi:hypothetical protein
MRVRRLAGIRVIGRAILILALGAGTTAACAQQDRDRLEKERLMLAANELELLLVKHSVPRAAGTILIRLAFPAQVDLDLFVTDPSQESIYFANSPAKSGGALEADKRCNEQSPRIETVKFENALPGVYRVGVDFPQHCDDSEGEISYVVHVESDAGRLTRRNSLAPRRFDAVALEFVVDTEGAQLQR